MLEHDARDLERLFDARFGTSHRTVLAGGGDEPLYEPPRDGVAGRIVYRLDYFASALHEVAHWCVAGARRRERVDFGYWYVPDGRSASQQAEFESVEVRPQALEWIFADACRFPFRLSADNAMGGLGPSPEFARAVAAEKERLLARLPARAAAWRDDLAAFYAALEPAP